MRATIQDGRKAVNKSIPINMIETAKKKEAVSMCICRALPCRPNQGTVTGVRLDPPSITREENGRHKVGTPEL